MSGRDQAGFTLVEVLVAILVAIAAVLATGALVSTGTANSVGQQRQVNATAIAQREIENARTRVKTYGFSKLAICADGSTVEPAATPAATDPNSFVTASGGNRFFKVMEDYRAPSATPLRTEQVVFDTATASCLPSKETTPDVDGDGTVDLDEQYVVHRYVTYHAQPCVTATGCAQDSKQLIVAVVPQAPSTARAPQSLVNPIFFSTVLTSKTPSSSQSSAAGGVTLGVNVGV